MTSKTKTHKESVAAQAEMIKVARKIREAGHVDYVVSLKADRAGREFMKELGFTKKSTFPQLAISKLRKPT